MEIFIANDDIKATFSAKGAELQSIVHLQNENSYLWSGDGNFWGKFSPVLFPIVGGLKDDQYIFDGKTYQLPRHGFARDKNFNIEQINEHEILFTLHDDEETLEIYPFQFKLGLRYRLRGSTISCTYEVKNPSSSDLYFSIGGHPAFAAPLNKQGKYTDYYLHFNKDQELTFHHIENNLVLNKTSTIQLEDGKLPLAHELFYNDALVIKTLKSDSVLLLNTKNNNGLDFQFSDFPYFGIWAAKDADFVCLEPWCGIADGENHDRNFEGKEGIIKLGANDKWQRTWQVTCF